MSAMVKAALAKCVDKAAAIEALKLMNSECEQHIREDTVTDGYYGNRKAEIAVGRAFFNGVSDIEFSRKNQEAELDCVYDGDDRSKIKNAFKCVNDFSTDFSQWYSAAVSKKTLENQGYACNISREQNGTLNVVGMAFA